MAKSITISSDEEEELGDLLAQSKTKSKKGKVDKKTHQLAVASAFALKGKGK